MMVMVMIFDSVSNPGALPKNCRISRSTPRASGPRVDPVLYSTTKASSGHIAGELFVLNNFLNLISGEFLL